MRQKIRSIPVKEIKDLVVSEPTTVRDDDTIEAVLDRMIEDPKTRSIYVLNAEDQVIGSIRMNSVAEYIFPYEAFWVRDNHYAYWSIFFKRSAKDFMVEDFKYVYDHTPVADMVRIMKQEELHEVPVVDRDMHILGEVNILETIAYFKTSRAS